MISGYVIPSFLRVFIVDEFLSVVLELNTWPVFDYLAIGPNLYLHYKAFWHTTPTTLTKDRTESKQSLK